MQGKNSLPPVKTWFGGNGSFENAHDWSPSGVPQAGDVAVINSGTCDIVDQDISAVSLVVGGYDNAVLHLDRATLGSVFLVPSPVVGDAFGINVVDVDGRTVLNGNVTSGAEGTFLTFNLAAHVVLVNTGTIQDGMSSPSSVSVTGTDAQLVNDGTSIAAGSSKIDPTVLGSGTIELNGLASGGFLRTEFAGMVAAAQTFAFIDPDPPSSPTSLQAWLDLDVAGEFRGTIAGFGIGDHIKLTGITATSDNFTGGVLTVFEGTGAVAHLHFAGSYTKSDFALTEANHATFIAFR